MASSAELWSHGERVWWISHEGEDGPDHLETDGQLSSSFDAIKSEMEAAQLSEDDDQACVGYLFEIPLQVDNSIVGFKHDEECPHISAERFVVLEGQR
jgi:hypothetical protein